ncbi:MAG: ABC transporter permease [Lachnospiraceae bacterium]|nr:ABC transporter permease [Ruminococcus sp.]MCM1274963.1 ABC transporter permease [Lachnospiraceae bacterium]
MRTKGWQKVFAFTLIQHIKTKSFIIGTIIVAVIVAAICVLTNILPVLINGESDNGPLGGNTTDDPLGSFDAVYIYDEAGILAAGDTALLEGEMPITVSHKSFDELVSELETSENVRAAARITAALGEDGAAVGYDIKTYYSSPADGDAVDALNDVLEELVNRRTLLNAGVAEEDYARTQIYINTSRIEAGSKQWNFIQSALNYFVPIVVTMVLFVLIFSYGQVVAQSIATEKTSRVMELLLTSVRPLAVVIGKVLAMGVVSFGQFTLIGMVGALSFALSAPFGMLGKAMDIVNDPAVQQAIQNAAQGAGGAETSEMQIAEAMNDLITGFSPLNILLIVIVFLLGFVFFSLVAALVGASVSRMEDLQQAMAPYSILGVLGMYLAYFPVIGNVDSLDTGAATTNPVQIFSYFFPVSSPFALPSAIMLGTMSLPQTLIAIAVLAAAVVLAAVIVGKVYEAIILHNGNRIKFGDILKMAVRK